MAPDLGSLPWPVAVLAIVLGAIPPTILAFAAYRTARSNARAALAAQKAAEDAKEIILSTNGDIRELGKRVDGRLTDLLISSKAAAHAAGVIEGKMTP